MKATEQEKGFTPITISINSKEELAILWIALGALAESNLMSFRGAGDYYPHRIKGFIGVGIGDKLVCAHKGMIQELRELEAGIERS